MTAQGTGPNGRTALLISSCWWPFTARIALRFAALGWRVEAVCPSGHPLRATGAVARLHAYGALRPLVSLRAAIPAAQPDLIIPCDDRAVGELHALHASRAEADRTIVQAIERSLGQPDHYPAVLRRSELIRIAREEGLPAPEMRVVETPDDLLAAIGALGLPIVLKVDGSWGGLAVKVARSVAEAEAMRAALARRLSGMRAIKRLLVDRNPYDVLPWLSRVRPRVNAQRFVVGHPTNSIVACRNGEVLASTHVEVLETQQENGPAQIVRLVDHPDMVRTTERLVRRLGLSGFCGFDFMIEAATGVAHLLEMNPRATPICHLALGERRDPVAAIAAAWEGHAATVVAPVTDRQVIALFPRAVQSVSESVWLAESYHDIPWEDPDLIRELSDLPYSERSLLARLVRSLRRQGSLRTGRRRPAPSMPVETRAGAVLPPSVLPDPCDHQMAYRE